WSCCFNPPTAPSSGGTSILPSTHRHRQPTAPSSGGTPAGAPRRAPRPGVSTHPPLLRAVGRDRVSHSVLVMLFQPTHRSFERWDSAGTPESQPYRGFNPPTAPSSGGTYGVELGVVLEPVSTHPPLLRAVGPLGRPRGGHHADVSTHPPLLRAVGRPVLRTLRGAAVCATLPANHGRRSRKL